MKVNSRVKINTRKINQLTRAQITALEQTTEALHTEVVQAQVMPRDTGALQNENTFVDYSESAKGRATLVSTLPYARRLYYHPEYDFSTAENPNAKGKWYDDWIDGSKKDFCKKAYKELYRRAGGV
jgi:hypothetical protein